MQHTFLYREVWHAAGNERHVQYHGAQTMQGLSHDCGRTHDCGHTGAVRNAYSSNLWPKRSTLWLKGAQARCDIRLVIWDYYDCWQSVVWTEAGLFGKDLQ